MESARLGGRGGAQPHEASGARVIEAEKKSLVAGSPDLRAIASSKVRLPLTSSSARHRGDDLRAGFRPSSTKAVEKSEAEIKSALEVQAQSEKKLPLEEQPQLEEKPQLDAKSEPEDLERFRPTRQEIDAAWRTIVENNTRDSAMSNEPSMSEKGLVESCKADYFANVDIWLDAKHTLSQIKTQQSDLRYRTIEKAVMLPGDILLRKESPPQSMAHATTLKFQTKRYLNGIEPNNGDHNVFHVAQWIGDKSDRTMDMFKEIAEARGGLGTTNAMRVLAHSIQTGQYWVYRARPEYGLPQDACKLIRERLLKSAASTLDGPLLGKTSSVFAEIFADKGEPYSKSMLSTSMRSDAEFSELTPERSHDAMQLAADPLAMSHVGRTSDTDRYLEVRTRENAVRKQSKGVTREGGDCCSTFVVRTAQTAALQIAASNAIEKLREKIDSDQLDDEAKQELARKIAPTVDGDINDLFKNQLAATLSDSGGLLAKNAEGIAPKTVEHFCRAEHDFTFVGVLTVAPDQVLREEMRFDQSGNPVAPEQPSAGSERDDCCVAS